MGLQTVKGQPTFPSPGFLVLQLSDAWSLGQSGCSVLFVLNCMHSRHHSPVFSVMANGLTLLLLATIDFIPSI